MFLLSMWSLWEYKSLLTFSLVSLPAFLYLESSNYQPKIIPRKEKISKLSFVTIHLKYSHTISCLKIQSNYNKQIHYKISQEHDSIWNKKFISLLPHKYSRKFHLTKNDQAKALERKEKKCKKIPSHETFSSKPNRTLLRNRTIIFLTPKKQCESNKRKKLTEKETY